MKLPKGLTLEYIMEIAGEGENAGFCMKCGEQADGVEPDACGYECESCGSPSVYGAEELVVQLVY